MAGSRVFNGTSDFITLATSASLNMMGGDVSLAAWVYLTVSAANYAVWGVNDSAGNNYETPLLFIAGGGPVIGEITAANTSASSASASAFPINVWTHVALTYNDSTDRLVHIYVNGVDVTDGGATPADGIELFDTGFPTFIGNDAYGDFFQGNIAEARAYNTALTAGQIAAIAADTAGDPNAGGAAANLVAYLHLCGLTSPEPDASGNGNTGALTGTTAGNASPGYGGCAGAPTLVSIAVTPTSPSIALGLTQQFTAIGTYSDSSTADITNTVTWASATPSVATIAAGGLATSVAGGTTNVSASLSAITSNSAVLTVTLFGISGNAGRAGATVSWTGTSGGSTTADGSGNYTIPSLTPGAYTITPTFSGYTFSPTSHSETISSASITGVNFTASVIPVPPPPTPTKSHIPLPFTQRMTTSAAVFACIGVASPQGILRTLAPNVPTIIALQLEYAQLLVNYQILRRQDIVAQRAVLVAAVTDAVAIVTSLHATIDAMTATGDNAFVLERLQSIVGSALWQIRNVQFDES